jgi:hypothetical protein
LFLEFCGPNSVDRDCFLSQGDRGVSIFAPIAPTSNFAQESPRINADRQLTERRASERREAAQARSL